MTPEFPFSSRRCVQRRAQLELQRYRPARRRVQNQSWTAALKVQTSSTLISLQALVQYNDRAEVWAANLRFAWLRTANSGLYVVYNEIQDLYGDLIDLMTETRAANRSLIIKYTYLFDVLK